MLFNQSITFELIKVDCHSFVCPPLSCFYHNTFYNFVILYCMLNFRIFCFRLRVLCAMTAPHHFLMWFLYHLSHQSTVIIIIIIIHDSLISFVLPLDNTQVFAWMSFAIQNCNAKHFMRSTHTLLKHWHGRNKKQHTAHFANLLQVMQPLRGKVAKSNGKYISCGVKICL